MYYKSGTKTWSSDNIMGHKIKPKVCEGCKVPKGWGEELIIENNEMYCGNLLIFKKGCGFRCIII